MLASFPRALPVHNRAQARTKLPPLAKLLHTQLVLFLPPSPRASASAALCWLNKQAFVSLPYWTKLRIMSWQTLQAGHYSSYMSKRCCLAEPGLITGIKQRVMAYIYLHSCKSKSGPESRRRFFYHFDDYSNLAMWKVSAVSDLGCRQMSQDSRFL